MQAKVGAAHESQPQHADRASARPWRGRPSERRRVHDEPVVVKVDHARSRDDLLKTKSCFMGLTLTSNYQAHNSNNYTAF